MGRMTTADQLVTEGRSAELAETLLRLLPIRFNRPVPADKVAMVKGGSLRDLRTWTDRVVTADSMDQVFNPKINGHKGPDGSGPKK